MARPFIDPLLNRLEIFNELCILVESYHLIAFTPFVDDPAVQYNVGWSMIVVTIFNIVINMSVIAWASFKNLKL